MIAVADALTSLVAEELPALVYVQVTPVLVRQVAERLLDNGLADVGPAEILAQGRLLGLTEVEEVELERHSPLFSQRLFLTMGAAGLMPCSLTDLDRLVSAVVGAHLELAELDTELRCAVREQGLILRDEMPSLDEAA